MPTATQFLAYTNNTVELAAHPDKCYPRGRKMWMGYYSARPDKMDQQQADGSVFTGNIYNGRAPNDVARNKDAAARGLYCNFRLYGTSSTPNEQTETDGLPDGLSACNYRDSYTLMETSLGRAKIRSNVVALVTNAMAMTTPEGNGLSVDDSIIGWYICPHEFKNPPRDVWQIVYDYMRICKEAIASVDIVKKRPIFYDDAMDATNGEFDRIAEFVSTPYRQTYHIGSQPAEYWYGGSSYFPTGTQEKDKLQYRMNLLNQIQDIIDRGNASVDPMNGEKRVVLACLPSYLDPGSSSANSPDLAANGGGYYLWNSPDRLGGDWIERVIRHDVWMCLMLGVHGFSNYELSNTSTARTNLYMRTTVPRQQNAYILNQKLIMESGFEGANLWGADKKGTSVGISLSKSGTYLSFNYSNWNSRHSASSIRYFDKQHNRKRFIIILNTHPQNDENSAVGKVPIVIGNLPTSGVVATNIITGTTQAISTSGTISRTLEPLEAFVLTIESIPLTAPTVTTATADKSIYELNDIAVITAEATGDTGRKWQYRNKGETLETDWKDT